MEDLLAKVIAEGLAAGDNSTWIARRVLAVFDVRPKEEFVTLTATEKPSFAMTG